jgi:glycosyltransferase involved in cell wall biosynthesis
LLCAHPTLDPKRISIVPHRLNHVRLRKPALQDSGWPVVGVIGHIAQHKGAQVVQDLARYIESTGALVRIVIVGTIDLELPAGVAFVTGPYHAEDLPAILERHGVNVGFFPSICPETFSYVTEEMMMMELPLLVFDLGAPGERVASYSRGQVIPVGEPDSILLALESLYRTHLRPGPKPSQP